MTNRRLDAICGVRIARLRTVDTARAWNKTETQCVLRRALSYLPMH
jgi:hypothetical protein